MLLNMLALKFGKPQAAVEQQIIDADSASLNRWATRFFAATLDEVFR